MADTYKILSTSQLPSAAANAYTPGTGKMAIIKNITLVNQGANTETVVLYVNGTDTAHQWGTSLVLSATGSDGASAEWDGTLPLNNADFFAAKSTDATAVTMIVSGDEIS